MMIGELKAMEIINKYLSCSSEAIQHFDFPIIPSKIYGNNQLCQDLIDCLGDLYIVVGLNENYQENECGCEIQEAIRYLAFCNDNV